MANPKQDWLPLFEEFIKHLRINSKEVPAIDSRGAPLNLWRSQKIALKTIVKGMDQGAHTFMFGKARQLGISTIFEALDIFWLAIHPGMMGAYVCDREENRSTIREKITRFMGSFPPNFFGKSFQVEKDNKDFMLFSNNSRLDFIVAGTKAKENWGEGRGYAMGHLTEVSKFGSSLGLSNFRETLSETNPDRLFIYESTSNGMNHWKELWEEFGRDTHGKRRTFLGWWSKDLNVIKKNDPRYRMYGVAAPDPLEKELIDIVEKEYGHKITSEQLAWYRYKHSDTSVTDASMHQNLPWTAEQSFVATGYSFFQMPLLQQELERCRHIPYRGYKYLIGNDFWSVVCEQIVDQNRKEEIVLRVWEDPDPDGTYSVSCDPAYGRDEHKDRHGIQVMRCFGDKIVQVAEYADNAIDTRQAAWVLAHLAGAYRNCVVNVEINGPGGIIITELENLKERMKVDPRFDKATQENANWDDFLENARWYLYRKPDHWGPGVVKCWETTSKTKAQVMHQLRDKFVTDQIVIRSKPLVEEMMDVIMNGDSIEAPSPAHDDRVFSLALAVRTWIDSFMMSLLTQGDTYERYVAVQNGEPVDKSTKMINNIVRDFFIRAEERAQVPIIPAHTQWLYDKGFK